MMIPKKKRKSKLNILNSIMKGSYTTSRIDQRIGPFQNMIPKNMLNLILLRSLKIRKKKLQN